MEITNQNNKECNKLVYILLLIFLGFTGAHKFYAKQYKRGFYMLFLFVFTLAIYCIKIFVFNIIANDPYLSDECAVTNEGNLVYLSNHVYKAGPAICQIYRQLSKGIGFILILAPSLLIFLIYIKDIIKVVIKNDKNTIIKDKQ